MRTQMAALFKVLVICLARVSIGMKALDRILELLQDSQLHSLDEIKAQIPLPTEKLALILDFLAKFDFIELTGESSKVKITPRGLAFIEHPSK